MHVLISGAGIAGSSLAHFLAKAGARVSVVEKAPALLPHGQNVDIQGSAVTAMKKMGLLGRLKELNTTEKGTQFINNSGLPIAPFPVREGSIASLTSEYEILRGDLALILYESVKDYANVSFSFGTTVKQVISRGSEADLVKVELSNGEVQEYDLLVAADGQWSKTRRQCFPSEDVTILDKDMYIGYYTIPRLPTDNDFWNIYFALEKRIVTLRPDPHGTVRAMFSKMPCNAEERQEWQSAVRADKSVQVKLLKKEFAGAGWQIDRFLDGLDQAPDFYFQAMQQIKMKTWSTGRVVCLGDAAHAPTPLTGIGTSLAITGAYVLAGELSRIGPETSVSTALQAYEAGFRPYVEKMQEIVRGFPGIIHSRTEWQRRLLQTILSTLSWTVPRVLAIPWVAQKMYASNEENNDGFPLPKYDTLDGKLEAVDVH